MVQFNARVLGDVNADITYMLQLHPNAIKSHFLTKNKLEGECIKAWEKQGPLVAKKAIDAKLLEPT